jgi:hypothetical protein
MKKKLKLIKEQLNRIEELLLSRENHVSDPMQDVQQTPDREFSPTEDLWMPQPDINQGRNCQCN